MRSKVRSPDHRRSQAAGFALRAVQLAAVATYFLSAWAKVRFGGWDWVNSATMVRAVGQTPFTAILDPVRRSSNI